MKKTVIFNIPDDFVFPEKFEEEICLKCPLWTMNAIEEVMCFLTGDSYPGIIPCPFFHGADTIVYKEIEETGE